MPSSIFVLLSDVFRWVTVAFQRFRAPLWRILWVMRNALQRFRIPFLRHSVSDKRFPAFSISFLMHVREWQTNWSAYVLLTLTCFFHYPVGPRIRKKADKNVRLTFGWRQEISIQQSCSFFERAYFVFTARVAYPFDRGSVANFLFLAGGLRCLVRVELDHVFWRVLDKGTVAFFPGQTFFDCRVSSTIVIQELTNHCNWSTNQPLQLRNYPTIATEELFDQCDWGTTQPLWWTNYPTIFFYRHVPK